MRAFDLTRRAAAEALGTGLLVATVVGSGIMAENLTKDVALALLANTLATGSVLIVLITIFGPLSGAHFNPVVSGVFWLRREIKASELATYTAAQIVGGMVGTIVAHGMFGLDLISMTVKVRSGVPQWFAEFIATFGLVVVILGGIRFAHKSVPVLVGAYIIAAYWFTASTSFANPAVAVARSLTATFSGIRPTDLPGFALAQIVGGIVALMVMTWLLKPSPDAEPMDPDAKL